MVDKYIINKITTNNLNIKNDINSYYIMNIAIIKYLFNNQSVTTISSVRYSDINLDLLHHLYRDIIINTDNDNNIIIDLSNIINSISIDTLIESYKDYINYRIIDSSNKCMYNDYITIHNKVLYEVNLELQQLKYNTSISPFNDEYSVINISWK